jgi:hypothetical protein
MAWPSASIAVSAGRSGGSVVVSVGSSTAASARRWFEGAPSLISLSGTERMATGEISDPVPAVVGNRTSGSPASVTLTRARGCRDVVQHLPAAGDHRSRGLRGVQRGATAETEVEVEPLLARLVADEPDTLVYRPDGWFALDAVVDRHVVACRLEFPADPVRVATRRTPVAPSFTPNSWNRWPSSSTDPRPNRTCGIRNSQTDSARSWWSAAGTDRP